MMNSNILKNLVDKGALTLEEALEAEKEVTSNAVVGAISLLLKCCRRGGFRFVYALKEKDIRENSTYVSEIFEIDKSKQKALAEEIANLCSKREDRSLID